MVPFNLAQLVPLHNLFPFNLTLVLLLQPYKRNLTLLVPLQPYTVNATQLVPFNLTQLVTIHNLLVPLHNLLVHFNRTLVLLLQPHIMDFTLGFLATLHSQCYSVGSFQSCTIGSLR